MNTNMFMRKLELLTLANEEFAKVNIETIGDVDRFLKLNDVIDKMMFIDDIEILEEVTNIFSKISSGLSTQKDIEHVISLVQ